MYDPVFLETHGVAFLSLSTDCMEVTRKILQLMQQAVNVHQPPSFSNMRHVLSLRNNQKTGSWYLALLSMYFPPSFF